MPQTFLPVIVVSVRNYSNEQSVIIFVKKTLFAAMPRGVARMQIGIARYKFLVMARLSARAFGGKKHSGSRDVVGGGKGFVGQANRSKKAQLVAFRRSLKLLE